MSHPRDTARTSLRLRIPAALTAKGNVRNYGCNQSSQGGSLPETVEEKVSKYCADPAGRAQKGFSIPFISSSEPLLCSWGERSSCSALSQPCLGRVGDQRRKGEEKKTNTSCFGVAFSQHQHFAGQARCFHVVFLMLGTAGSIGTTWEALKQL